MCSAASPESSRARRAVLAAAYREACLLELRALKPGNVHVHGGGHGMTVEDFELSAEVSAAPLTETGSPVGRRLRDAMRATWSRVGANTNLGILLLAAPLLAAGERAAPGELRAALLELLESLTIEDAVQAYEAIRLAQPAGLGQAAAQDVASRPTIALRQAMALAAGRDRIARQYATGFEDVFEIGVARLVAARRSGTSPEWAATYVYLSFLAAFPDSHVERKLGQACAEAVRTEAAALLARIPSADQLSRQSERLLAFDRDLKARGINPGTSADLAVASLLAAAIADIVRQAAA
jgi:triphosphoribosyl-dephospho-CoA synthase